MQRAPFRLDESREGALFIPRCESGRAANGGVFLESMARPYGCGVSAAEI